MPTSSTESNQPWSELSVEQQTALRMAYAMGHTIQYEIQYGVDSIWHDDGRFEPHHWPFFIYRIKPQT